MITYINDLSEVRIKTPLGSYKTDIPEFWAIQNLDITEKNAGQILKKVSKLHRIPYLLALPFCTTESGGKSIRASDGLSYGIMQCNAATLDGVIKEALKGGMTIGEFKYIYYNCRPAFTPKVNAADIPPLEWPALKEETTKDIEEYYRRDALDKQLARDVVRYTHPLHIIPLGGAKGSGAELFNVYNQKMLSDKEFAAHVGCMYLYQLLVNSIVQEKGVEYARVDWMINGYNAGWNRSENPWKTPSQAKLSPDVWYRQASIPSVTKDYVKRLCGVGGYLDLIKQGKFKLS